MGKEESGKAQVWAEPKKVAVEEISLRRRQDCAPMDVERVATRFVYRSSDIAPSQETSIWLG
jgi:hypothetical protein